MNTFKSTAWIGVAAGLAVLIAGVSVALSKPDKKQMAKELVLGIFNVDAGIKSRYPKATTQDLDSFHQDMIKCLANAASKVQGDRDWSAANDLIQRLNKTYGKAEPIKAMDKLLAMHNGKDGPKNKEGATLIFDWSGAASDCTVNVIRAFMQQQGPQP